MGDFGTAALVGPKGGDYSVLISGLFALGSLAGVIALSFAHLEVPAVLTGCLMAATAYCLAAGGQRGSGPKAGGDNGPIA
jgi:dolichol kinase